MGSEGVVIIRFLLTSPNRQPVFCRNSSSYPSQRKLRKCICEVFWAGTFDKFPYAQPETAKPSRFSSGTLIFRKSSWKSWL